MVGKVAVKRGQPPGREAEEGCGLLLSRIARAANRSLACALGGLGLRAQQFAVLHRLAEAGPSPQADLAASLRLHASNLVRVLDEIEELGLVARERDPADRRRQLVVLTAAGAAMLRRADRIAAETERELLAPLSGAERAQLRALLARVATHACATKTGGACAE
jgi:MarR family transcriptional regulator, lower aerobic nicotinate degradation pathway regulator